MTTDVLSYKSLAAKCKCVLFIDDEKKLPEYYINKLRSSGFEVRQCRNVEEAKFWVEKWGDRASAYVLDIMMAESEDARVDRTAGIRLYDWIRKRTLQKQSPQTPIIILSNRPEADLQQDFKDGRLPADQRLSIRWKPDCTPEDLVDELEEMIGLKENEREDFTEKNLQLRPVKETRSERIPGLSDYFRRDLSVIRSDVHRLRDQARSDLSVRDLKALLRVSRRIESVYTLMDPEEHDTGKVVAAYKELAAEIRDPEFFEAVANDSSLRSQVLTDEGAALSSNFTQSVSPQEGLIEWYTGTLESIDGDSAYLSLEDGRGREYDAEFKTSLFEGLDIPVGGRFFCVFNREGDDVDVVIVPRKARPLTDEEWELIKHATDELFEDYQEEPHDPDPRPPA